MVINTRSILIVGIFVILSFLTPKTLKSEGSSCTLDNLKRCSELARQVAGPNDSLYGELLRACLKQKGCNTEKL